MQSGTFQQEYIVDSNGGEITIPVTSTGIGDVSIELSNSDKWNTDPNNGDRTPAAPWISVTKVIENYPQTKALLSWTSGVVLSIEQNKSTFKREAIVQISSFTKKAKVNIVQAGLSGLKEKSDQMRPKDLSGSIGSEE